MNNPVEVVFNCNPNSYSGEDGEFGFILSKAYKITDIRVKKVRSGLDPDQFDDSATNGINLIAKFKSLTEIDGADQILSAKSTYFTTETLKMDHTFPLIEIGEIGNSLSYGIVVNNQNHILLHQQNGEDLFGPYIQFDIGELHTKFNDGTSTWDTLFDKTIITDATIGSLSGFIEITMEIDMARGEVWDE